MTDFHSLGPMTRAYALVGNFLMLWAAMESGLRRAMGKALGLDETQTAIIGANIQLRDKIHIVRTAVDLSSIYPEEERKRYKKVLRKILKYSGTRNMMAHDLFGPSTNTDGVAFNVVQAKGELQYPDVDWSIAKFEEEFERVANFANDLNKLVKQLDEAALLKARAEARLPPPIASILGLTVSDPLYPHPQDSPDSDTGPSTPQTNPQTLPSVEE